MRSRLLALWVGAAFQGLPFVTYQPGLTVNVLGENGEGEPIIDVEGRRTYADSGQLRERTPLVPAREYDALAHVPRVHPAWIR